MKVLSVINNDKDAVTKEYVDSKADASNIPTKTSDLTNDSGFITSSSLPTKVSDLTNDSGFITNTVNNLSNYYTKAQTDNLLDDKADVSSLSTVATTGSYNDLSNKPTIPTVNNATLTIQKNGTTVKTFTANASSNVTANITVPTKTSDLTNDSGFVDNTYHDSSKQDTLVSGTNIKTINNESILGSGNISISSGTSTDVKINGTSITSGDTANIAVEGTYNASTNKLMTKSEVDGYDASWIFTSTRSVADFNAFYNYVDNGGIRVYVTSHVDNRINTTLVEKVGIGEIGDEKYINVYTQGDLFRLVCDGTQVTLNFTNLYEYSFNKVTSLSSSSSDGEYPSAKCVYDNLNEINDKLKAKKINLTINTDYVYSTDWDYDCLKIGNVVFLSINTIAFKVGDIPNYGVLLSNLPKPSTVHIFLLAPNVNTVQFRVAINLDGQLIRHWTEDPVHGDSANKQYSGTIIYFTND